jgi:hypothetical protein
MTSNPDRGWMVQQARNMALIFDQEPVKPKYLLRDRDRKFVQEFDALLAAVADLPSRLVARPLTVSCRYKSPSISSVLKSTLAPAGTSLSIATKQKGRPPS